MSVEERQAERDAFLLALYELADGDTMTWIENYHEQIGRRLSLSKPEADRIARYLTDHGFAKQPVFGDVITITTHGIDEAERLLKEGEAVPLSVAVLTPEEGAAVEAFLTQYRSAERKDEIPVEGDDRAELDADVATMDAQMHSPRPKRKIIKPLAKAVYDVLVGAAGNSLYDAAKHVTLYEALRRMMESLGQ